MKSTLLMTMVVLPAFFACSPNRGDPQRLIRLNAQTDALKAKILLTELREGRLTNALELLELELEVSVISIDHSLPRLNDEDRSMAMDVLRSLKAYRTEHPRRREAILPDADSEVISEKAGEVFRKLK